MEIHQLEYFIAIVETGSFSRAAERCNIAQPSLSQQIKKLETEIGHLLFDRLGRSIILTDAGKILIPKARKILEEVQGIKINIQSDLEEGQGSLAVGFIPTVSPFVLPEAIKKFSTQFPKASLEVHEDLTDEIVRKIVNAKLDLGITSLPIKNKHVKTEELLTEELLFASSDKFNAIQPAHLEAKDLEVYPFIALSEVHCLGEQVQSFCIQENVNLDIVCHSNQLSTVKNCLVLGLGVSLVPKALAISENFSGLEFQSLADSMPLRKIVAVTHAKRPVSRLAKAFIEIVKNDYPSTSNG